MSMKVAHTLLLGTFLVCLCAAAQASPEAFTSLPAPEPVQRVDAIVNNFRKIAVLTNGPDHLDRVSRQRVEALAWTLSQENQGRIADLMETFADSDGRPLTSNVEAFLDKIERPGMYRDCDRLAFEAVFEALYASRSQFPSDIRNRIEAAVATTRQLRGFRVGEPRRSSARFQETSFSSSVWESYLTYLNQKYRREQLLKEHASILPSR